MANRGAKGGKKAAKSYERPGLSDEEIEEIKEAFNLFDTDGSGMFKKLAWFGGKEGVHLANGILVLLVTSRDPALVFHLVSNIGSSRLRTEW